ncbi:MAG: UPF0175 family protein [Hormoscilla sp.]
MKLEVKLPDRVLEEDPERVRQVILIQILGSLYHAGQISGGVGARIMGCNRWEFYELLSQHGFAVIDYPDEELEKEAEVAPIWYKRVKNIESSR